MSIVIRPARLADVVALAAIAVASYRETFLPIIGEVGLALRSTAYFEARFAEEWPHIHLAVEDAGPLGFAEVRKSVLDMLFIMPGQVGRGIGALLLRDAEGRGARMLECFAANEAARRFYVRHGWREVESYEREFASRSCAFVAYEKP